MEDKELQEYTVTVTVKAKSKREAIADIENALDGNDVEWLAVE